MSVRYENKTHSCEHGIFMQCKKNKQSAREHYRLSDSSLWRHLVVQFKSSVTKDDYSALVQVLVLDHGLVLVQCDRRRRFRFLWSAICCVTSVVATNQSPSAPLQPLATDYYPIDHKFRWNQRSVDSYSDTNDQHITANKWRQAANELTSHRQLNNAMHVVNSTTCTYLSRRGRPPPASTGHFMLVTLKAEQFIPAQGGGKNASIESDVEC